MKKEKTRWKSSWISGCIILCIDGRSSVKNDSIMAISTHTHTPCFKRSDQSQCLPPDWVRLFAFTSQHPLRLGVLYHSPPTIHLLAVARIPRNAVDPLRLWAGWPDKTDFDTKFQPETKWKFEIKGLLLILFLFFIFPIS